MSSKTLRLVPLGGLGEVGKNMMAIEYGDDILVVDTGIMFPENDMLGIDYIIPDFGHLKDKANRVRAIIVTHGHEDHTGAIRHVLEAIPAPVYATPLTRGLLEAKLSRGGLRGRGVLALMADSTNAERPGWTPSEAVIDPAFDAVFRQAPGRILIGTFASLISRIQQA